MKKIGILSMQRIINYGSFLQAYALKKIIEELGEYEVQFVDYNYEGALYKRNEHIHSRIKRYCNPHFIPGRMFLRKAEAILIEDLKTIGVDDYNYNADIDTLVIGSDEVFNCTQLYPVGYSRELFGKNYEDKRVISYAASFGFTAFNDLQKYNIDREISEMLQKFYSISVRDDNSYTLIHKLTGRMPEINCDPVIAYSFIKELEQFQVNESGYILIYAYTFRLSNEEKKYIKDFAKRAGKKIISVGNYCEIADKNITCNPLYVFSYFRNADYVITDTFHGSIFSLKTNSKFCALIRGNNENKMRSLLRQFGREDRIVESLHDILSLYEKEINYSCTNEIILLEQRKTKEYLKSNL